MPFFANGDVTPHYEVHGRGDPVVLLHGFTGSFAGTWPTRGWVHALIASAFRVDGLDLRSHGRSDRIYDASEAAPHKLAADVVALLDRVDIERAAVVGFSMGGGVALQLAMDVPGRIQRVVVSGVGDAALNRLHDPRQIAD